MVEARKDDDERPVADSAADASRFADASAKLFAQQATAFAVMTAYGMSVAAQMTGMMLGALRGPAAAEEAKPATQKPSRAEEKPSAKIVPLRPQLVEPAELKVVPAAEVAPKPVSKTVRPAKAKAPATKPPAAKPTLRAAEKVAPVSQPTSGDRDDLKKIPGIGPRLEQELNDRGITRYDDIATLGKAAVKKLDAELGLGGRIIKDDWAGQAKALSGGKG